MQYRILRLHETLQRPQGIFSDDFGNLLLCESRRNYFRVITSNGEVVSSINKIGDSGLQTPSDCCTFSSGHVAVMTLMGKIHIF